MYYPIGIIHYTMYYKRFDIIAINLQVKNKIEFHD